MSPSQPPPSSISLTAGEVAARIGGRVEGDASVRVTGLAGLKDAKPGDISFLSNERYAPDMATTRASVVIVAESWAGSTAATLVRVGDPNRALIGVTAWYARASAPVVPGVHPSAVVAAGVDLGPDVSIGPYAVIEPGARIGARTIVGPLCYIGHGVAIGPDCRFYPHASVREFTRIGARCIVHNGAVLGSDGFGYYPENGAWKKIPQVGVVVLGDDVEIGANVTVDRARFGETRIESGVKIDNLCQIAHNVVIGRDTAMAAQTGVSGSATIGARVQVGGQVGVAGHLSIGDDSVIGAQSGISKTVAPKSQMFGTPAMPQMKWARWHAHLMRVPELRAQVAELQTRLEALEAAGRAGGRTETESA